MPQELPDPLIGQLVADRYRISYLVAEGGMGRVYSAEQILGATSRKVAIKVLLAEYSGRDQDMQRFLRECSTVAELEHPNTIKFYDYGETPGGDLFIAMEFLSGKSLAQVVADGPMAPERVDLIVGQICGALQEAHDRGIVHRDLKPDNIVITSPGGAPDFVKVLDFGIAKRVGGRDPKLTPLGVVLGSPPYMSPEQFTLQEVDPRSDVYSLGVVAYQMLTGKLPFDASDPLEWAALHMSAMPDPITDPSVPPQMKSAVMRALGKHPHQRQEGMRQFFGEFTLGTGSMPPGRVSSVMPEPREHYRFGASDLPLPRPPRAPTAGADDDVPTAIKRDVSAPLPLVLRREDTARRDDSQPEISAFEMSASELSIPPHAASLPAGGTIPTSQADPERGSQGTIVLPKVTSQPVRAKLTMPDLLPPTVREPELTTSAGRGRSFFWVAAALLLVGGIIGTVVWVLVLQPPRPSARRDRSATPTARRGVDAPPTPVDVKTGQPGVDREPPPPAPAPTAPASAVPVKEKLSPCQTAIFSAVSGKCDVAHRAYERCSEDSPYRASATRAITGLCP